MTGPDTEILSRLVATLESARARKPMYFSPVEPRAAESWLNGLRTGAPSPASNGRRIIADRR